MGCLYNNKYKTLDHKYANYKQIGINIIFCLSLSNPFIILTLILL